MAIRRLEKRWSSDQNLFPKMKHLVIMSQVNGVLPKPEAKKVAI
jgi:hypothetical protein